MLNCAQLIYQLQVTSLSCPLHLCIFACCVHFVWVALTNHQEYLDLYPHLSHQFHLYKVLNPFYTTQLDYHMPDLTPIYLQFFLCWLHCVLQRIKCPLLSKMVIEIACEVVHPVVQVFILFIEVFHEHFLAFTQHQ